MFRTTRIARTAGAVSIMAVVALLGGCESAPATSSSARADDSAGVSGPVTTTRNPKTVRWERAIRGLEFDVGRVAIERPRSQPNRRAAQRSYERGLDELNRRNDFVAAIGHFRDALEYDAAFADALESLGDALRGKGRSEWAIAAYRSAIDSGLDSSDVHYKLAIQLWGIGSAQDAITEMNRSGELNPDRADVHERLAIWQYYLGDYAASWDHVREAEARGGDVPPQFLPLLEARMSEPGS